MLPGRPAVGTGNLRSNNGRAIRKAGTRMLCSMASLQTNTMRLLGPKRYRVREYGVPWVDQSLVTGEPAFPMLFGILSARAVGRQGNLPPPQARAGDCPSKESSSIAANGKGGLVRPCQSFAGGAPLSEGEAIPEAVMPYKNAAPCDYTRIHCHSGASRFLTACSRWRVCHAELPRPIDLYQCCCLPNGSLYSLLRSASLILLVSRGSELHRCAGRTRPPPDHSLASQAADHRPVLDEARSKSPG